MLHYCNEISDYFYLVANEPVFDTSLLLSGNVNRQGIQRQLSRWEQEGRLQQVRRGLYSLAPPYRHVTPHPFLVANHIGQSILHQLSICVGIVWVIPEYTPVTVSVTTLRTGRLRDRLWPLSFSTCKSSILLGLLAC